MKQINFDQGSILSIQGMRQILEGKRVRKQKPDLQRADLKSNIISFYRNKGSGTSNPCPNGFGFSKQDTYTKCK